MYGTGTTNNFAELMSMAKQNAAEAKRRAANAHLFPDASKPKREDPKQVKLKEGVQKFLQKREEEDRRRKQEEKLKKEKLFELRNQDRKATNRVRKMLSMTKSANKSCVDDAKDCLNDSVTAQTHAGDFQPDEDDYGYTSNYADQMHKKMMDKYKAMPVKPAFPQSRTPVPAAQSLTVRKNWRDSKPEYNYEADRSPEQTCVEDKSAPNPNKQDRLKKVPEKKKPQPPDYRQLLQLAQQKTQQPLPAAAVSVPLVDKKIEKETFEFGRPMTAKEKEKYLREKEFKDRAARKYGLKSDNNNNGPTSNFSSSAGDSSKDKPAASFKIPRANKGRDVEERVEVPPPKKPKMAPVEHVSVRASPSEVPKPRVTEAPRPRPSEPRPSSSSNSSSYPVKSTSSSSKPINGSRAPPNPTAARMHIEKIKHVSPAHSSPRSPSSPRPSFKPRDRDRDPILSKKASGPPPKPEHDKRLERVHQERLELIKEKPRYLSAFDGGKERDRDRDRDPPRKQLPPANDSRKSSAKPSSIRDAPAPSHSKSIDSRDKGRNGNGAARAAPDHYQDRDRDRRPMNRDRERMSPPPSRREMPPPQRREGPQPQRREMPPSQRREMPPSQRREMPPSQRREMPSSHRREMPPPHSRDMPMRRSPPRMRDEPPPRMKPKYKGRAVIDSDEEYDSEMDDFIDDSEQDLGNISEEISRIFKYDRRKYQYDESDDDDCMESSVAEQLREEQRSLRIGIQEDLEDIRREEEEKRMKMLKMKKKGR